MSKLYIIKSKCLKCGKFIYEDYDYERTTKTFIKKIIEKGTNGHKCECGWFTGLCKIMVSDIIYED